MSPVHLYYLISQHSLILLSSKGPENFKKDRTLINQVHAACPAKAGISSGRHHFSLEMRMKCGIGMCGRCNIGDQYVCKDGPVFSLAQLNELPQEY